MRKIFSFALVSMFVLSSTLFVGCESGNTEEPIPTYTITIDEAINGSVTLEPQKELYEEGETVLVSFTGNTGELGNYFCKYAYMEVDSRVTKEWNSDAGSFRVADDTTIYSTFAKLDDVIATYYVGIDINEEVIDSFSFSGSLRLSGSSVRWRPTFVPAGKLLSLNIDSADLVPITGFMSFFQLVDNENEFVSTAEVIASLSLNYIETGVVEHDIDDVFGVMIAIDGTETFSDKMYSGDDFDLYFYMVVSGS